MSLWVWLALGAAAFLSLLFASSIRFDTSLTHQERLLRLRYLGSAFVIDLQQRELSWRLFGWRVLRRPFGAEEAKPEEAHKEAKPRWDVSLGRVRRERHRLADLWRYFRHTVHLERLEVDARLATPDPVWTGTLYGLASSFVNPLKAVWPQARLHLRADFVHELPSGSLNLALRARVLRLAVLGIKAFLLARTLRTPRIRKVHHGNSRPAQRDGRGHAASR